MKLEHREITTKTKNKAISKNSACWPDESSETIKHHGIQIGIQIG